MMFVRPIKEEDLEAFFKLAQTSSIGITNLPKNKSLLEKKIHKSLDSFSKRIQSPEDEYYIFVLEDIETGAIGGTCAISSKIGAKSPCFFYQHSYTTNALNHKIGLLQSVLYNNGPSEICALYLMPQFRKEGYGRLLSLSRFLFIAAFPERFDHMLIAEMRGYIDQNNRSPFWEGLGRHFLDMDFEDLLKKIENEGRSFIPEILPKHPIYESFLSEETRNAIGVTHESSKAAIQMLYQEGFVYTNEVDIFDAGPKIAASKNDVKTIKYSKAVQVKIIKDNQSDAPEVLLANNQLDFRACYGKVSQFTVDNVCVDQKIAQLLNLQTGNTIIVSPIHKHQQIENKARGI